MWCQHASPVIHVLWPVAKISHLRLCSPPSLQVPVGRRDATAPDPDGRMPEQTATAQQQLANFAAKGLGPQELMVLSGSHTVRQTAGCSCSCNLFLLSLLIDLPALPPPARPACSWAARVTATRSPLTTHTSRPCYSGPGWACRRTWRSTLVGGWVGWGGAIAPLVMWHA